MRDDDGSTLSRLSTIALAAAMAALFACGTPATIPVALQPAVEPLPVTTPVPASLAPNLVAQQGVPLVSSIAPRTPPAAPDSVSAPDSASVAIARSAMEVFGDSEPVVVKTDTLASTATWDIDVHSYETTSQVEYYVQYFSGPARDRIVQRLDRGTRYEPMIRRQMRDGGLPEDMYYLALIESGFDPNAYSNAAAVGMWQFMTSTARDMGLRVDWWVDERRDPVRSTWAAVRYIRGLRDQFGSLYLAAAAYNGGPVRIANGLTRYADDLKGTSGDDLFFALADKSYLRGETKEYVPQLIAAALVAKAPTRYGMEIQPQKPFAYDSVRVGPLMPLAAIAKATGTSVADIKDLNQHLLRGMTPPGDSSQVRVPTGTSPAFDSALASLPSAERVGARSLKTKEGETMSSIAKRVGISTAKLTQFNPSAKRLKNGDLAVGQTLLVPTDGVVQAATSVPDPSIERFESVSRGGTHVVVKGETLGLIAKHNGISVAVLMRANALKRDLIFPGQILVLPKK